MSMRRVLLGRPMSSLVAAVFGFLALSAVAFPDCARAENDSVMGGVARSSPDAAQPEPKPVEIKTEPKDIRPLATQPFAENEAASIRASSINAAYTINWLGSNVGNFILRSTISNRNYTLQANADISVFFGSFTWQGITSSKGLMTANGPVPQTYSFRYSTGEKRETVELRFTQRMVRDIIINPPARPGSGHVPITAAHLQNVVDPLSAVIMISQARLAAKTGENACNRRLPVFDGRVRYDIILSPKGTRQIGNAGKFRGTAYVCSVRYTSIAGHKAGKRSDGDYVSGNTGIEIWLVPMADTGLMMPYYITVPTPAGTASMTSVKFDVEKLNPRQAAAAAEKG